MTVNQKERFDRAWDAHLKWCLQNMTYKRSAEEWLKQRAIDLTQRLEKEELKVIDI